MNEMMFALTLDQRQSRRGRDAVASTLLDYNARFAFVRPFERTSGDEMQALVTSANSAVDIVLDAVRTEEWWIGLGVGRVDDPVPSSVRAASGPALENARAAVERAKGRAGAHRFVVVGDDPRCDDLATVLTLLSVIIERQSPGAIDVERLYAQGLRQREAAAQLGITQQTFSERLRRGAVAELSAGRDLAVKIAADIVRP